MIRGLLLTLALTSGLAAPVRPTTDVVRPAGVAAAVAASGNPWIEVVLSGAGTNEVAVDNPTPTDPNSLISAISYADGFAVDIDKDAVADGFNEGGSLLFDFVDGDGDVLDMASGRIGIAFNIEVVTDPGAEVVGVAIGVSDTGGDFTDGSCVVVGVLHRGHGAGARRGFAYRTSDLASGTSGTPTSFGGYYTPGYGNYGATLGGYRQASGVTAYSYGAPATLNDTDFKGGIVFLSDSAAGGTVSVKYRLRYTWWEEAAL